MNDRCKYCNKEIEIKSKNSMAGHSTGCKEFKEWRDSTFTYEFLYKEYIENGKSALQIANEHGWNSSTIINKQLKRLNMPVRNIKESHKMELYRTKIENTNLEKYGAINPLAKNTTAYEKRNNTVVEKYGVNNVFQAEEIKKKIKDVNIQKYGAYSAMCNDSVLHDNYINTIHLRYGTDNAAKNYDIRKKQRIITLSHIEQRLSNGGQITPSYNISSIPIIEQKAMELGITDLQHAENGGEYYIRELGYFLDGYSKEKNVVIEYDEKYHFDKSGNLRERDVIRQNEIQQLLGCEFIRIKEYEN
jgi:galactitol-specific phosphotransferase system IIB component